MGLVDLKIIIFGNIKKRIDQNRSWMMKIPGLMRLMNYLYKISKPTGLVLIKAQGMPMYINCQDDVISTEILAYGCYEKLESRFLEQSLKPGMTVVDLGANIGYYTLLAARAVGPTGKVYAFEPDPYNYELLTKNIQQNGFSHVEAIQAAVSNQEGSMPLFQDEVNFGAHTLCAKNIEVSTTKSSDVKVLRLDQYLKEHGISKIDFLKMDIQGAEGQVLETINELIELPNLKMFIEYWPEGLEHMGTDPMGVLKKLSDAGFSASTCIEGELRELKTIQEIDERARLNYYVNLFFERKIR